MLGLEADVLKHHEKISLAIEKLELEIEAISRQSDALFKELNVLPEQIHRFVETKESFTEENWQTIQELKKKLDEKLLLDLANIGNPNKTKKTLSGINPKQHWLFVR